MNNRYAQPNKPPRLLSETWIVIGFVDPGLQFGVVETLFPRISSDSASTTEKLTIFISDLKNTMALYSSQSIDLY